VEETFVTPLVAATRPRWPLGVSDGGAAGIKFTGIVFHGEETFVTSLLATGCRCRHKIHFYRIFLPPPSPRRWTGNVAIADSAFCIIKTHEHNTFSERILRLCLHQSRLAGSIMFWTCLFVVPFVRVFSVSKLWMRYFENEWTDFSDLGVKGMQRSTSGVRTKVKSQEGELRLEAWQRYRCRPLECSR